MPKNSIYRSLILNEDEMIIKTIRQTGTMLIISLFLPVVLIILPFFFMFFLFNRGNPGIVIFFITLIIGIFWLIRSIVIWYFKIFIITSQRIIDIDQKGLFQKIVSNVYLTKIQDVYYQTRGIFQTLGKIGNIYIIITDSKTKIEIINISQPYRIQQLILQAKADTLKEKLDSTQLSAQELLNLVKKIKAGIGEEKFNEIIKSSKVDGQKTN